MSTGRHLSARPSSRVLAVLIAVAMAGTTVLGPGLATAQEVKAGVVTALQGQAVVARPVIQQPLPLKFKDDVFVRDRVETREDSLVRILLGGKALVTVRELSTFTVTEEPNRVVIDLRTGKAAVGVAPSLLRPGESIEMRTPNAVAGIRGSLLVVTVEQVGSDIRTTFEAPQASKPITVSPLGTSTVMIELNANQSVGVVGTGAQTQVGPVTNMTPAQAQAAAATAEAPRPKEQAASSPMASGIAAASMAQATQLVAALQGAPTPDPLFQQATINKAQGGGATENLANQLSATSQLQVDATRASLTVAEDPSLGAPPAPSTSPVVAAVSPAIPPVPVPPPVVLPSTPAPPVVAEPPPPVPPVVPPVVAEPPPPVPPVVPPVVAEPPPPVPPVVPPVVAEPPPEPLAEVAIIGQRLALPSGQSLKTFTGTSSRMASTPVVLIDQSAVAGDSNFVEGNPGSETTIGGALLRVTNSTIQTDGNVVHLGGARFEAAATPALLSFSFDPTTVNAGTGVIRLDGDSGLTVHGSLLAALATSFQVGDPTHNTPPLLGIFDGSSLEQTASGGAALLLFDGSSVDSAGAIVNVRRSPSTINPSRLTLDGPLFRAVNGSRFNTTSLGFGATFGTPSACCTGFNIRQGAEVVSTTTEALIQLAGGSVFNSGPDAQSGGTFFGVSDTFTSAPAGELVAPSSVRVAGPLLRLTEGSRINALFNLLDITRSTLFGTSPEALIQLDSAVVTLGGPNRFADNALTYGALLNLSASPATDAVKFPASVSIGGPFLRATNGTQLTITGDAIGIFNGGQLTGGGAATALIDLDNSHLTAGPAAGRHVLQVDGFGGGDGVTPSTANLQGALLNAANGSTLSLTGGVLRASNGGQVVLLDPTLLEASLPLLKVTNNSLIRTATDAIDLSAARLTVAGDLLQLNASHFEVVKGALLNAMQGSLVKIGGNLVSLANGSTLNLIDGAVLNVSGNSSVFIGKALISFVGMNNTVNINNNLCTAAGDCATIGGLKVRLNGTPAGNVTIINNPIANLNGNRVNAPNAAYVSVSGTGSRVTITGVP